MKTFRPVIELGDEDYQRLSAYCKQIGISITAAIQCIVNHSDLLYTIWNEREEDNVK